MTRFTLLLGAAVAAISAAPASAAIVSLASNVDLSSAPYTVNIGSDASYTFSYSAASFSSPVSVSMNGTGNVYGNGFASPNAADPLQLGTLIPDQLSLGQFFAQTGTQPIPYSIALSSIALRFMSGNDTFYGYASVAGNSLVQFAYNDTPGGSITIGEAAAAVPEPATWALMMLGIGAIGATIRRRQRMAVRFVHA